VGGALAVAASALVLAAAYSVTPYTALGPEDEPLLVGANARYLTPALMMAAAASAWSVGCLGRFRLVFEAVGLAAVADGLRRGFDVPVELVLGVVATLAAAGVAAYLLTLGTQGLSPGVRLAVRTGFGAMAAAAVAAAGHERQQEFNQARYVGSDRALDWIARNAPRGHRIGLAGVWTVGGLSPVWPAFGPRLGNRVEFVGEFVHGQLREYDDPMRWGDAIRRNGYDLLVVGEGGYGACRVPGSASDDNEWARRAGFPLLAASDRLRLYRVTSSSARSPQRG